MLIFGNGQYFQDNCETMAQTDKTGKANRHKNVSE